MSRLILLPGLAADERMWAGLGEVGIPLLTPRLPVPEAGESMTGYALRVARKAAVAEGDLIGGCSFGGLVAAEIARRRKVRALLLVAGALTSATMTPFARLLGNLPGLVPLSLLRRYFASNLNLRLFFGKAEPRLYQLARQMLADTPDPLLARGGRMAVGHFPVEPVSCPVFAIHGALDRVMAAPPVAGCRLLPDAGHGLPISHPVEVTGFLREAAAALSA